MDRKEKILSLTSINKSFSGVKVLHNIDLDLYKGEVLCLVGENGAGKSTLIKILSGAEKPDSGKIFLFDKEYNFFNPNQAIKLGVSTIYQDVDLVDSLTVADNIYLEMELINRFGIIDYKKQQNESQKLIDNLNIKISSTTFVEDLSQAQKQMLQIVKALHRDARILIMDEPTASLGEEETTFLIELVKKLSKSGIGIIYISHYIEEIYKVGQRATVIKDGRKVSTYNLNETSVDILIKSMVGRDASLFYKKEKLELGQTALKVLNYSNNKIVKNVSFDVRIGEIFGIGGMAGSGRTELMNLIYGIDKKSSGQLFLHNKEITPKSPRDSINKGIGMIVEDRKEAGLFLFRSVLENIEIVKNESLLLLNLNMEFMEIKDSIDMLSIKVLDCYQEVENLSGGNQQKCVIARWLLSNSEVFIFDEPTKGVDIGAKEEIYRFMVSLAKKGRMIIMISSSMPELLSMSDRIGIMRNGQMVDIVPSVEATEDSLLKKFIGV